MVADRGGRAKAHGAARAASDPPGRARRREPGTTRPERLPELDRLIHERVRLGILSALAAGEPLGFADLKSLLQTTDGNLSIHARKLEDAGYVACVKRFEGRVPRSEYRLTRAGREALERYLGHLDALVRWARGER